MTSGKRRLLTEERVNPVLPVHIWRSPEGSSREVLIVTHLEVYATIHEHATRSLPDETGGFLLGKVGHDARDGCWHLEIDEAVPIEPVEKNPVHFSFTWREVDGVRQHREDNQKALIGWYHTHPEMSIFLSDIDLDKTHRVLFSEPFQIALVYDPVNRRAGYFFWEGTQIIDASPAGWREFEIAIAEEDRESAPASPKPDEAGAAVETPPAAPDQKDSPVQDTAPVPGEAETNESKAAQENQEVSKGEEAAERAGALASKVGLLCLIAGIILASVIGYFLL